MHCRKTTPAVTGFEDEKIPQAKERGQLLEAGKDRNVNSSLGLPRRNSVLPTLGF